MTIGLVMIVRDEEAAIGRCLASVRDVIDTYSIVDTGSVDATRERAREALEGVPGELHEREWVNFAHNRTEMLALARGSADYLLMLDADFVLHPDEPLGELTADEYMVTIRRGEFAWSLPLLTKGDRVWRYEGAAHSYLVADGPAEVADLSEWWVEDTRTSSPDPGKYLRDAKLLEAELGADPTNARAAFYLAQSYADAGLLEAALREYGRRGAMVGWAEETFVAKLRRGKLLVQLRDFERGLGALLEAWAYRPTRAEPLWHAARAARLAGHHSLALMLARQGVDIPLPNDRLFVETGVYEWGLRDELARAEAAVVVSA